MAVTPIFSYTPQNATLIAGMLVGYSTATADPDSNSGTWSPWNGITEIGDIGNSGAFVEQTTLAKSGGTENSSRSRIKYLGKSTVEERRHCKIPSRNFRLCSRRWLK